MFPALVDESQFGNARPTGTDLESAATLCHRSGVRTPLDHSDTTRRASALITLAFVSVLLAVAGSGSGRLDAAPGSIQLRQLGQIGGGGRNYVNALVGFGPYLLMAEGPRVVVVDPLRMTGLGASPPLPGLVQGVSAGTGLAFAALGEAGLAVLDMAEPTRPQMTAIVPAKGAILFAAALGSTLFVADSSTCCDGGSVAVLDLTDPHHPTELASVDVPGIRNLVAVDGYVYAGGREGLVIVDVRDPRQPRQVATLPGPRAGAPADLAVRDGYAYVVSRALQVVDVHDPSAPREVYAIDDPAPVGSFAGIDVGQGLLLLASNGSPLHVFDLADPARPAPLSSTYLSAGPRDYLVLGRRAYGIYGHKLTSKLATSAYLGAVDLMNPRAPREAGFLDTVGLPQAVAVGGDVAFVADIASRGRTRIVAVDVANPAEMRRLGQQVLPDVSWSGLSAGGLSELAVHGGHLIAAGDALNILDISDPAAMKLIGRVELPFCQTAGSLALSGNLALVGTRAACTDSGDLPLHLYTIDLSDPAQPAVLGGLPLTVGDGVTGLAVAGGLVYAAAGRSGLAVVDVSDPSAPRVVGKVPVKEAARTVNVLAGYALVGTLPVIQVFDVSEPARPRARATASGSWYFDRAILADQLLYLADEVSGVVVLDVHDPTDLRPLAMFAMPGTARSLGLANGHIFVAADDGGLVVAQVEPAPAASSTPSPTATDRWPTPSASPLPTARAGSTDRPVLMPFLSRP